MGNSKHDELMMTLKSFSGAFSVSETRDKIMNISEVFTMDSATLRRWVYSKFITLERQGVIVEVHDAAIKTKQYRLADELSSEHTIDPETIEKSLIKQLKARAAEYRLQLNIQMGQVEEYAQLSKLMPSLKVKLSQKERELADHNSELLGRLKAVESLLADKVVL